MMNKIAKAPKGDEVRSSIDLFSFSNQPYANISDDEENLFAKVKKEQRPLKALSSTRETNHHV